MRLLVLFSFIAVFASSAAIAQTNGSQDSAVSGKLRPRWGSYLIETFPSPAKASDNITVQFYNHKDETLSCRIYDSDDRLVLDLQPKQPTPQGLHKFVITANQFIQPSHPLPPSGVYFIRLTTFTDAGAEDIVDVSRFVIVK